MSYKVKYGDILNYIASYEMCGELYDLEGCVKHGPTKGGYTANLIGFKIDWLLCESKNLKYMPRKKKKKLVRLFTIKYNNLRKLIHSMEE